MQRSPKCLLLLAVLGVLALAPAAHAGGAYGDTHQHLLDMYKVERFQSLQGGDGVDDLKVSCNNGDYAVDGMWRVDAVDQSDDWDRYNAVEVYQSESVAKDTWSYSMVNDSDGQAQVHLWVTCLGRKTAPDTKQHDLVMSDLFTASQTIPAHAVWLLNAGEKTCDAGQIAVAHGFSYTGDGQLKIFKSWPADGSMRRWILGFYAPGDPDITTSVRCLDLKTSATGAYHRHLLRTAFRHGQVTIGPDSVAQAKVSCGDQEKGLLGAFDVRGSHDDWGASFDSHKLWYLGQEPQLKSRVFHVWNHESGPSWQADFGVACFGDRTSGPRR